MQLFFAHFALIAGSFLILRKVVLATGERKQSGLGIFFVGVVSWVFILSVAAWLLMPLYLIYALLAMKALGAVFPLMFIGMATGFAFQVKETLDGVTVLHFLRQSAMFHPMRPHTMVIQDELDKKKIREVHRETSDKPFPKAPKEKQPLTQTEIKQYRQARQSASTRPARSIHYQDEIKLLQSGAPTSITDGWKVYAFDHRSNDLYNEMSAMHVDPATRTFRFDLNIKTATERALQDSIYLYQLKQDLYLLLSVLNTDPWLAWYAEFFDRMVTVCFGIEPDSFGHVQLFPFLKIDIMRSELTQREGMFFNAADLHKISTLTFNNGNPLPENLI
jgi:hypothetical protein